MGVVSCTSICQLPPPGARAPAEWEGADRAAADPFTGLPAFPGAAFLAAGFFTGGFPAAFVATRTARFSACD